MNITIIALGSRGDVQPHIALGVGLKAAGHTVKLVTHNLFEPLIRRLGLDFSPVQVDPRAIVEDETGQNWLGSGGNSLQFFQRFSHIAEPLIQQAMLDCWQACQGTDAIIISPLAICIASSVAEKLAVPLWIGAGQPLTATGAFAIPFFPDAPRWLPARQTYSRLTYTLSARLFWRLLSPSINSARHAVLNLPPLSSRWLYENLRHQRLPILYYYSPSVLPSPPDWGNMYHVTGYWFLDDDADWQPPAELLDFLAAGSPPVYVGFGSMNTHRAEAMTDMVLQALARTKQRGILLRGWGGISSADLPDEVFKIDFAPHDWLFPRMDAIVQHGGAGTMAASLRAGIPSVVIPFFGDQSFWGRHFHALGLTPRPIPQKRLTTEQLANALRIVISDTPLRERVAAFSTRIQSENGVERAVEILQRHLLKRSLSI